MKRLQNTFTSEGVTLNNMILGKSISGKSGCTINRASGRSRNKRQISWDFQRQILGKMANFAGILWANFAEK